MHEEAILDWVLELRDSSPEVIENVDRKTLQVCIIVVGATLGVQEKMFLDSHQRCRSLGRILL